MYDTMDIWENKQNTGDEYQKVTAYYFPNYNYYFLTKVGRMPPEQKFMLGV